MTPGRVVHVIRSDGFAGVERYVVDTATELDARGWDVTVIGGNPTRMRAELPAQVSHRDGATVAAVARALWSVGRADVVHAHMTAAELPAAVLKRRLRSRLVVTRHFAARRGRSFPARVAGAGVRRALDRQISISRFVAEAIGEPSVVLHNGVRPSWQQTGARRSLTVLVMQRLEREKDTATALRAWAISTLPQLGWQLVLHGRGSERDHLAGIVRELGVEASVRFAGFTENPRAQLATASIMLASAPAEPFGLAVVEAMAEGTPVVATDGGAHRETLGPKGEYFAPGDAAGCAAALDRMAGDSRLRESIGAALLARAESEFSIRHHVDRLVHCYESSID